MLDLNRLHPTYIYSISGHVEYFAYWSKYVWISKEDPFQHGFTKWLKALDLIMSKEYGQD